MKPRFFAWLAGLVLASSCLPSATFAAQPAAAARPNVLFIFVDDLRPELGCYGVEGIKTPNIDRLAQQSVRFANAFVQYPLCAPQRTSLLTGRYPTSTGVLDNRTWWGALHPDWKSLPRWFKDHGYATLRSGKVFHGGMDDTDAWSEGGEKRSFEGAKNTTAKGQVSANSDRIVALDGDGEEHIDYRNTTKAIEYLRSAKNRSQPFFLAYGLSKPHSPPTAPRKLIEQYDVNKIPLPRDFMPRPTTPAGFPKMAVPLRNGDLFIERDASESAAREMKRAYWASTSFTDANVGRVLTELDKLGLRESTIIVFWGDHGYHLGEKGKWSKHNSLLEIGTRVPLLISAPRVSANGRVCERVVEALGLYATLVDLAGLPMPEGLQSPSLASLVRDPAAKWDRPAYSVTLMNNILGRAVRTERWRYVEWDEGREGAVLFDRANDPHELQNLAQDARHAKTVLQMRALLSQLPGRTK